MITKVFINSLFIFAGFYCMYIIVFNLIQKFIFQPKRDYTHAMNVQVTKLFDKAANKYGLKSAYTMDEAVSTNTNKEDADKEKYAVELLARGKEEIKMHSFYVANQDATKVSAICMEPLEDESIKVYHIVLSPKSKS